MDNVSTVRITNLPFGEVIGKYNDNVKYFTVSNNDKIYRRLISEFNLKYLPYLGANIFYGKGETCLEEDNNKFYYYVIDRQYRVYFKELDNIYDAIDYLVIQYTNYFREVDKSKMRDIFLEELNLEKGNRKTKLL